MNVQKKTTDRSGSILVTLLFLISVLALLVATVASDSLQTLKTVSQSGRDTQAKYAAFAGMEMVMNELRKQDRYIGDPIDGPNHGHTTGSLGELDKVAYDVLIWNNMTDGSSGGGSSSSESGDPIEAQGGVQVQPDTVYMISTGTDTVQGEEVVLSSLAGTARRVRPVFEDAAYARSKMIVTGAEALVDAWDSGGGWTKYVAGDFPAAGSTGTAGGGGGGGGGGGAGGPGMDPPTVQNYKATLGTDSPAGRTLRLLSGSKLNGHFRIGPMAGGSGAFSQDSGSTSSSGSGGVRGSGSDSDGGGTTTTTSYGVATASTPADQIAGVEGSPSTYHKVDDKTTEMPRFMAPYNSDDLVAAPTLNNPSSSKEVPGDIPGTTKTVTVPPAPVDLEPGGYTNINVPSDQTLRLSPGVYYFHEGMDVSGKITLAGGDPVIVFVGKKAVFNNAEINKDGRTSSLQFCFTDEEKDPEKLSDLASSLAGDFEPVSSGSSTTAGDSDGGTSPFPGGGSSTGVPDDYVGRIIAPYGDPDDPTSREGASQLEINGGEFYGSVAGKNLIVTGQGGDIFGAVMANVFKVNNTKVHQDLALKGSNLMNAGGWALEGVHQVR